MIQLAVLKDGMIAGQRKAAGKQLRHIVVLALDRYQVLWAESTGDNPLVGKTFFANFGHMVRQLTPEEVSIATPQLQKVFGSTFGRDLTGMSIGQMDAEFGLGARNGADLVLYDAIRARGNVEDSEE